MEGGLLLERGFYVSYYYVPTPIAILLIMIRSFG